MIPRVKTYQAQHLKDLHLSRFQTETLGCLDMRYGRLLQDNSRVAQSLFVGRQVMACWGLLPLWGGVSEAWMLVSDDLGFGRLLMIKSIQQILDVASEHRIQTSVLTDFAKGIKFVGFLGFELEGRMKKYDVLGRDHYRFARLSNG